ncbi:hypothetical protein [Kitasatospora sp. McL0602]|uniref:hypothetical protein n=1 Tax=Kitasatospora sp. McL0602 TaxID=3439530 RepID=UPI003F8A8721
MTENTALAQADSMIATAWNRPIEELEADAGRQQSGDLLLKSVMRIRSSLVIWNTAVAVHRERLHALTRPGFVPDFHDLQRITDSAGSLRTAYAESQAALQSIRHVVEARESAPPASGTPTASRSLSQAAVTRSANAPADGTQLPSPAASRPTAAATVLRR